MLFQLNNRLSSAEKSGHDQFEESVEEVGPLVTSALPPLTRRIDQTFDRRREEAAPRGVAPENG